MTRTTTTPAAELRPRKEPMVNRKVRFPRADAEAMDAIAEAEDRTFNWLVRRAVREYLDRRARRERSDRKDA